MVEIDLERVHDEGTPLIDGEMVTFVWSGASAPRLMGDFAGWTLEESLEMQPYASDVWIYRTALPSDAYIEYVYCSEDERLLDPLNRQTLVDELKGKRNYFYMQEGEPTPLTRRRHGVSWGRVTQFVVDTKGWILDQKRTVTLYRPPVENAASLLVVFDGQEYLQEIRLPQIVDNLIADRRISPIALAMLPSNESGGRSVEYACNDNMLRFLLDQVIPLAQAELKLIDPAEVPGAYGVLGASMGGLMALYAGLRLPHIFGHVLSQSGVFAFPPDFESVVFDLLRGSVDRTFPKVWMDVGKFERMLEVNRQMQSLLVERGAEVVYREYNAAHNYPAWRDDLWRGLEAIFPPPLED